MGFGCFFNCQISANNSIIMNWNFKKFCIFMAPSGEFLCHFFSPFLAPCFSGNTDSYGQPPTVEETQNEITSAGQLCSEVLSEDLLLSRSVNPGLQPQAEAYN